MRLGAFLILWLGLAAPAAAQTVVTSPGPDRVAVTVYRDVGRAPDRAFDLNMLNGFALVSETRRVRLPAGESELRFEGVAGGIVPQSAHVAGFPQGIVERNRDAYLLSPATLLDRSLGRRVILRRTSRATGRIREEPAVIRSGAAGAVVLQTRAGFESLRCAGLAETPIYREVPPDLSARPTLSVRVRAREPVETLVTLSYLASGFDWRAHYVADLAPDGRHVDLFAWLTLASNDETSFVGAEAMAVAGRINREPTYISAPEGEALQLSCWPQASTSDIPLEEYQLLPMPLASYADRMRYPNLESQMAVTSVGAVTVAYGEDLGDLKLYRVPEPVTLAANSQKQIALLIRPNVSLDSIWRTYIPDRIETEPEIRLRFETRNSADRGLGVALPAGGIAIFIERDGRRLLLGEGSLYDRAIGERFGFEIPAPPAVEVTRTPLLRDGRAVGLRVRVRNVTGAPIRHEAQFLDSQEYNAPDDRFSQPVRRDGYLWLWTVDLAPGAGAEIDWEIRTQPRSAR